MWRSLLHHLRVLFLTISGLLLFAQCGLLGGGGNEIVRSTDYRVTPLPNWKAIDRFESDKAFRLPSNNVVTITSSCKGVSEVPLDVLTRQLLIGGRNLEWVEKRNISVDGANGLFSRLRATYDNVRAYLIVFVLPKEGCVYDFSLMSNKMIPDADIDDFLIFIKSFHYGKS